MWTFILRRLLAVPPLLFGVALITFVLQRSSPGDFFAQMRADPSKSTDDVLVQMANAGFLREVAPAESAALGVFELDGTRWEFAAAGIRKNGAAIAPAKATELRDFRLGGERYYTDTFGTLFRKVGVIEGFGIWAWNAVHGDFGVSLKWRRPVFSLIGECLWNTLKLSLAALAIAWGIALPLGVLAAVRPNSLADHLCAFLSFFGLSIPSVFFALLMVLFASYTGWFPIGDMRDVVHYDSFSFWGKVLDELHHLCLPALVIGTTAMAGYMRQTRGNMVEALGQDFVRTARAKGVAERGVLFKHALRNAINPLITLFGYSLAALLTGSFLVEVVMNWPGLARLVYDAIFAKDEPVMMAAVLMGSTLLVAGNLVADLLLACSDPRVRLS
ncbi:MAG: ABC transporter permease [Planctomycetes bacterium]|nr:ABC transporter permease [Planctomycetota bacterium]